MYKLWSSSYLGVFCVVELPLLELEVATSAALERPCLLHHEAFLGRRLKYVYTGYHKNPQNWARKNIMKKLLNKK
jgi:hypothetical protein